MSPTQQVIDQIRADADRFDGWKLASLAALCREHAERIERARQQERRATTDLAGAARYSGYAESHLRKLSRDRVIENVGRKHAPRFIVSDLPIKTGHTPPDDWWRESESRADPEPAPAVVGPGFDAAAVARRMLDAA